MIELKNVTKVYKSKKGSSTVALKDINLKLGSKGLTFILGKSGSGKSTLLNILGGLDTYTSGDLVINGKSTKEFKEKHFDSYRNTYMGFVFQEFNLLDNYTIEENIKLSLELQNKKVSSEEVKKALNEVELEDILKRKPNELSGGQKQRVAIARAIIKNPEIILADEPTGNLDSVTSTQIFNILKKISKEKLVIIVSHDEESAKTYADRIIKIKDGMIESDKGKQYLDNNTNFNLVPARLPIMYSLKMGINNLFHKKIRLVFSCLLIILCLVCFGLMISANNYDVSKEYISRLEKDGPVEVWLNKYDKVVNQEQEIMESFGTIFTGNFDNFSMPIDIDESLEKEAENKTNLNWSNNYMICADECLGLFFLEAEPKTVYYMDPIAFVGNFADAQDVEFNTNIIGRKPVAKNEILITKYMADHIMYYGVNAKVDNKEIKYKPTSYNQILNDGYDILMNDYTYVKIVGILDQDLKEYAKLKEISYTYYWDMDYVSNEYKEIEELDIKLGENVLLYDRIYVTKEFINELKNKEINISFNSSDIIYNNEQVYINEFGFINTNLNIYKNTGIKTINTLKNNEVVINTYLLNILTDNDYSIKLEEYLLNGGGEQEFLENYLKDNNIIGSTISSSIKDNKIYNDVSNYASYGIVGVFTSDNEASLIYYNKNIINELIDKSVTINSLFTTISTKEELEIVLENYPIDKSDIISWSNYSVDLLGCMSISYIFKILGKYGTLFFLIFASVLLMNFINTSIKFRKKEIGILKALGCKSIDVFKMFIYECLVLIIICLSFVFVIVPKICNSFNSFIKSFAYIDINIFDFNFVSALLIIGVILIIMILANIIPIRKVTKMKPIDIILDK